MGLLGLFSRSVWFVISLHLCLPLLPSPSPTAADRSASLLSCSNVAAFAYPSYASYKSITTNDQPQIERWLVYWCVVGALTGAEGAVGWIVAWIPFYSEIKLGIMLWMVAPQTEVSQSFLSNFRLMAKEARGGGDELWNEGKEGEGEQPTFSPSQLSRAPPVSSFGFLLR